MNATITTHVLDTSLGRPAQGVGVTLEMEAGDGWRLIGQGSTDPDGRLLDLVATGHISEGKYRLRFATGAYFAERQIQTCLLYTSSKGRKNHRRRHKLRDFNARSHGPC